MASIITSTKIGNHRVDKYNFKALNTSLDVNDEIFEQILEPQQKSQEVKPFMNDGELDASAMTSNSKDSLIESLLKKTDEMSSNFIKLQMRLESMSDEHKKELLKVKQDSFEEGKVAGVTQAQKDDEKKLANIMEQFFDSISKLEKSAQEFESALENIKKELIGAAIDIAKEVIKIELGESSSGIAEMLSKELIKELQSASKITLKVNPKDHGAISEKVGSLAHVSVVSDRAISQGGVIAISDAGNIDAQISKRFERVKKAALSE